jgi:hypothetical protein
VTLRLELTTPARVALDQPLVAGARLHNDGTEPVTTSARLNLHEGDLLLGLTNPHGASSQVVWAWPIDSALRRVDLAPGAVLESGVLVHWAVGGLVMPIAGRYQLTATFTAAPGELAEAEPVDVTRTDATGEDGLAAQQLVLEPDVARSLAAAAPLGTAAGPLEELARRGPAPARLLAGLARSDAGTVRATVGDLVASDALVLAAEVVAAVVPPGLYPGDERVEWAADALSTGAVPTAAAGPDTGAGPATGLDRARAVLAGQPRPA